MLRAAYLSAAIAAALGMPSTEALAGSATGSHGQYSVGYHRGFHAGYRKGYEESYRRGFRYNVVAPSPADAFGAALLGATYGYWSDGYRTYGGDPCYRYNDRDWDWERVC